MFSLPFVKVFVARALPASSRRLCGELSRAWSKGRLCSSVLWLLPNPGGECPSLWRHLGARGRIERPFHLLSIAIHHSSSAFKSLFKSTIV